MSYLAKRNSVCFSHCLRVRLRADMRQRFTHHSSSGSRLWRAMPSDDPCAVVPCHEPGRCARVDDTRRRETECYLHCFTSSTPTAQSQLAERRARPSGPTGWRRMSHRCRLPRGRRWLPRSRRMRRMERLLSLLGAARQTTQRNLPSSGSRQAKSPPATSDCMPGHQDASV